MNKFFASASVAAIILGFGSAAQAQTLSNTIGQPVIDQMSQFENGNWINRAINTAAIDGSVNIIGIPNIEESSSISGAIDVGLGAGIDLEGSGIDITNPLAGAIELGVDVNAHLKANVSIEETSKVGGAIVKSTDVIKTVAAGAVNTGHIATAVSAASDSSSTTANISLSDLKYVNGEVSQASASTSNTAAEALAAEGTFASLGNLSVGISQTVASSSSGPAMGVYAVNEAFNNADINGSVNILSNGTDLAGISTVAAGAVNTGTISLGFDGAALNSAINGGGN
ncbi:hypothetical protein L614_004200000070 [Ochrobactrum sp. J50]|uniref:Cell surface protein n=3 Tax=Brucella TaxID=234 RepID=A0A7V6PCN9_9HYPH|nr:MULTISPECIES: hypothetical protein [Brucella/Ochrobactrum group]WPM83022.1 hypothetical protein R5W60_21415 [Brucella pseudintermedia]KAB2675392.1 hypothetical protein F9L08_27850 [Brucella tritici]MCH6206333.1 hypothetical protein [Brucella ciceri]PQA72291.1 hypothetical protein C3731_17370 [Brucella oryzae]TWG98328.1 hypothetical protein L614_004200000070 [Ochrobactrum sp. J50]